MCDAVFVLPQPELIVKYGYPVEIHNVTTADGYILTLHRIPYSPKSPAAPNKPVVFLQHGILASSADWIILGPENSLGKLLVKKVSHNKS
jgi:lysosomal acid lipase/cholesteryl ester hydrolase